MPFMDRINKAFAARPKRRTLTITTADLTASAGSQSIDIGAALPAGACVIGAWLALATTFSGGGASSCTADLGVKGGDTDSLIDGADLFTAAGEISSPAGVLPAGHYGAITPAVVIAADVNVDTLTAGSVTVNILYTEGSKADMSG